LDFLELTTFAVLDCHFLVTFAVNAEDRPPQFFEPIRSKGIALSEQLAAARQNTGSRQELQDLVRAQLQGLLEQENFQGAKTLLVPVQPADIAEAIEELPEAMQALAFRLLSKDEAIAVYEYLNPRVQQALLEEFKRQDLLEIVDRMSPDA
jgi:magnesium transporter